MLSSRLNGCVNGSYDLVMMTMMTCKAIIFSFSIHSLFSCEFVCVGGFESGFYCLFLYVFFGVCLPMWLCLSLEGGCLRDVGGVVFLCTNHAHYTYYV